MLGWLRPVFGAIWRAPARALLAARVSPNAVTIVGTIGVVASSLWFFPQGGRYLFWGVVWVTAFVMTDMLDGTMARLSGKTSRLGSFLDSTLDRVADAAVFGAISWAFLDEHRPTALAGLVAMALGSVVPYARAKAESLGIEAKVGIAERADRLFLVLTAVGLVGLGLPREVLTYTLWALALAAAVTITQRTWVVVHAGRTDTAGA